MISKIDGEPVEEMPDVPLTDERIGIVIIADDRKSRRIITNGIAAVLRAREESAIEAAVQQQAEMTSPVQA